MDYIKKPYIPASHYKNILSYQYKGGDLSLTYVYFISPLCNKLVSYFPLWLAPNVITITGFFLNIAYVLVTLSYTGFKGGVDIPPWACIFCALCYFTYNILDNCDGKQARRTNSSSPLGLLVDHGTDACTTFFIAIGLGSIMAVDNIWYYGMIFLMTSSAFYLSTWEEYVTGELILPVFNGVSDGMVLVVIIEVFTAFAKSEFWLGNIYILGFNVCYNQFLCFLGMCGGIFFSLLSIYNVFKKVDVDKVVKNLVHIIFYIFFYISFACVASLGSKSYVVDNYPKIVILLYGFLFAKVMGLLQLAHIMNGNFQPYTFITLPPLICLTLYSIIYNWFDVTLFISIDILLIFFFFLNFAAWVHFVRNCSKEMCNVLNINVLSISTRNPSDNQQVEVQIANLEEKKVDIAV